MRSSRTAGRRTTRPRLIYDGTLATQETTIGSLAELADKVKQASDRRPAVLVVGRVAALREHLRWFDARPLFGKRILVTRPREAAAELADLLEALGAQAIEAPMIRILPPEDYGPLDEACATINRFDWVVFTSANAVDAFMRAADGRGARPPGARRRPGVRGRAGDRRAARAPRAQGGSGAPRVSRRNAGAGADRVGRRPRLEDLPAARRHRARSGRRGTEEARRGGDRGRRLPHGRGGSRTRERAGHLPDAPGAPHRRRDVHERVGGEKLRQGAGRTSPPPISCEPPSSRRSARSRPRPPLSTRFRAPSSRRSTRFRHWSTPSWPTTRGCHDPDPDPRPR